MVEFAEEFAVLKDMEVVLESAKKRFVGVDWKEKIHDIASEFRRIGTEFAQQGKIKGFVLDINGVDASRPRGHWPEVVFESDRLVVRMVVSCGGKMPHIELEIGAGEVAAPVELVEHEERLAREFPDLFEVNHDAEHRAE